MAQRTLEPHIIAGQHYRADELGDAVVRAAHWRLLAFALIGLAAILALGNLYQATLPRLIPYYVEVEKESGAMRVVGKAEQPYDLREVTVKKEVREFIEVLRRVLLDKVFMQDSWVRLFKHVTPRGYKQLYAYAQEHDPLAGTEPVQVEMQELLAQSGAVYYCRWTERRYSAKGELLDTTRWSGLVTWTHIPPGTIDALTFNPSGIFIESFSITKEL